ncbi:MAG: Panacea domain-containing protein [Candidatus Colwellbacteria bacterium]|nr:Panacea domain-containing protein [Candidatus Colwellbacteria bacterium]MCK9497827.1 Panacea domain-containing protein [Candidatus Colwellbacteria bacterium]MDD3752901.1 Panacea domain-containing protein [Candidatus Colwellbacteria bacterium]MDD4819063.1 Panacea domain-containing protein [Candidatus Colwellbacteria bacterium]
MSQTYKKKNKVVSPKNKLPDLIKACIFYGSDKDGKITKTKLAKLVYLSDFSYYYDNLKPITGLEYRKLRYGPVSLEYFDKLTELELKKVIEVNKDKAEMISLKEKKGKFSLSESELETVKKVCKKWKSRPTKDIVDFTHNQFPWSIARENEKIPYHLITQEDASSIF